MVDILIAFLIPPVSLLLTAFAIFAMMRGCREWSRSQWQAVVAGCGAALFASVLGSEMVHSGRVSDGCTGPAEGAATLGLGVLFAVIAIIGYRRSGYVRPMSIDEALGAFWSEPLASREKMRRALAVLEKGPIKPEFLEMARAVAAMPPGWAPDL
jgi:hypothetical protein